ncbi:MAG: hypothetical protein ACYC66_14485, partial [Chloroflexota bacterium]
MIVHRRRSRWITPFLLGTFLGLAVLAGVAFFQLDVQLPLPGAAATPTPIPSPTIPPAKTHLDEATRLQDEAKLEEAIGEYQQAIDADPTMLQAYLGLAGILTHRRDPAGAVAKAQKALELAPRS